MGVGGRGSASECFAQVNLGCAGHITAFAGSAAPGDARTNVSVCLGISQYGCKSKGADLLVNTPHKPTDRLQPAIAALQRDMIAHLYLRAAFGPCHREQKYRLRPWRRPVRHRDDSLEEVPSYAGRIEAQLSLSDRLQAHELKLVLRLWGRGCG